MTPDNNNSNQFSEGRRNRKGNYSTVNDNTARGAQPTKKQKRTYPKSFLVAILIIVVLSIGGIYAFFNWDTIVGNSDDKLINISGTSTPIPTAIPTSVPTMSPSPSPDPTPKPTSVATKTPPPEIVNITISAIGDIMCQQAQIDDAFNQNTLDYDFTHNFSEIAQSLQRSDLVIGSSLTTFAGADQGYSGESPYNAPDALLDALAGAGVDVLTTGNGHIFDYEWAGVERTNKKIKEAGMQTTGTYLSEQDYYEPLIIEVEGVYVAILSFTDTTNGGEKNISLNRLDYGIKYIRKSRIRDNITIARDKGADIVILCLHWGEEYTRQESKEMRETAQYALEQGADIILGTKSHMVQRARRKFQKGEDGVMREVIVAYSLGNFISSQRDTYTDSGMILNIHYQKNTITGEVKLTGSDYVPTWVSINETDNNSEKNFRVLPIGKYLNTPELFNTLPQSAKDQMQKAWNETTSMVGMDLFSTLDE
ncbi:MAG: CapA family protein [Clostridiales bacterium]|nr:CapA family protein [Clostridiales bacterium]